MTTQIAVRLNDQDVHYLDQLVTDHRAGNRAEAVRLAIEAARRRDREAADLAAYAATEEDPEMDALAEYAVANMDLD